ncbi:hypothetical protein HPB50_025388 [Hyalomma asiaticum]|uniref:Uncharacterized protein n=1 Tax=Hyalomma asiaticum TaxID=266040 RepID=A0ACB7TP93_HYAAI|nr:hypothetical protein HPB50_025388 [Hyalomma asiaticum]
MRGRLSRLPSSRRPDGFTVIEAQLAPLQLCSNKTYSVSGRVKVWFQNRRTKHKRQKQEEEHSTSHGGSDCKASSSPRPPAALSPDIQMDDSSSDSTQPDPLS